MSAITTALARAIAVADFLASADIDGEGIEIAGATMTAVELKAEFEKALAAAVKAEGNQRPTITEAQLFGRLRNYVREAGSAKAAAAQLGIAPQFLCDIQNARRKAPAAVIAKLGFQRRFGPRVFEEI